MYNRCYVDGDWLIYTCSSIGENTYIDVKDSAGSFVGSYNNITAFKKEFGLKTYEDYEVIQMKSLKEDGFMKAMFCIKGKLKSIQKQTGSQKLIIALGGSSNFRDRIALPVKYKGNRDNLEKPLLYKQLRNYILKNYECEIAEDQEADDIISINQFLGSKDNKICVATLDKDSRGIDGHLYNPATKELLIINGLGEHKLVKKAKTELKGFGRSWEYIQWISGDKIDNYHPQDLLSKSLIETGRSNLNTSIKKLSHSKLYEKTKKLKTDKDWLQLTHDLYYEWYKDLKWYYTWDDKKIENIDYIDLLQCYVDVAHMRRWDNDVVDIRKVFKDQGIL